MVIRLHQITLTHPSNSNQVTIEETHHLSYGNQVTPDNTHNLSNGNQVRPEIAPESSNGDQVNLYPTVNVVRCKSG